jgi:arsenate reductase
VKLLHPANLAFITSIHSGFIFSGKFDDVSNKIYYLSTCDTCRKILKETKLKEAGFELQDIKTNPLSESQIDELAARAGSYEALVNKRATMYKEQKLGERNLSEDDFRHLLLQHYTFLKRPVIDCNGRLYVGNDKQTVAAIKKALNQ